MSIKISNEKKAGNDAAELLQEMSQISKSLELYTLTDDGTIYAEWTEEYPFEIGHFLWSWEFPMRDMEQSKSKIIVNGKESPYFINELLVDGYTYRAEFTSKDYDTN